MIQAVIDRKNSGQRFARFTAGLLILLQYYQGLQKCLAFNSYRFWLQHAPVIKPWAIFFNICAACLAVIAGSHAYSGSNPQGGACYDYINTAHFYPMGGLCVLCHALPVLALAGLLATAQLVSKIFGSIGSGLVCVMEFKVAPE